MRNGSNSSAVSAAYSSIETDEDGYDQSSSSTNSSDSEDDRSSASTSSSSDAPTPPIFLGRVLTPVSCGEVGDDLLENFNFDTSLLEAEGEVGDALLSLDAIHCPLPLRSGAPIDPDVPPLLGAGGGSGAAAPTTALLAANATAFVDPQKNKKRNREILDGSQNSPTNSLARIFAGKGPRRQKDYDEEEEKKSQESGAGSRG